MTRVKVAAAVMGMVLVYRRIPEVYKHSKQ